MPDQDQQQQWATGPADTTPAGEQPAAPVPPAEQPAGSISQIENTPAAPATPPPATVPAPTDPAPAEPAPAPAVASPAPADPSPTPVAAEQPTDATQQLADALAAMQSELESLKSRVSSGQLTAAQVDSEIQGKVNEMRKQFETWPQKGYDGAQPWDLQAHGLPQPGVNRDYLPAGQPDELSPVVISHNKPILIPGSAGSTVEELATLLAKLGYTSSISQGRNHTYAFDDTVTAAVSQFKKDFGVKPDPTQFPSESSITSLVVDAWVWEGLLRAVEQAATA